MKLTTRLGCLLGLHRMHRLDIWPTHDECLACGALKRVWDGTSVIRWMTEDEGGPPLPPMPTRPDPGISERIR